MVDLSCGELTNGLVWRSFDYVKKSNDPCICPCMEKYLVSHSMDSDYPFKLNKSETADGGVDSCSRFAVRLHHRRYSRIIRSEKMAGGSGEGEEVSEREWKEGGGGLGGDGFHGYHMEWESVDHVIFFRVLNEKTICWLVIWGFIQYTKVHSVVIQQC